MLGPMATSAGGGRSSVTGCTGSIGGEATNPARLDAGLEGRSANGTPSAPTPPLRDERLEEGAGVGLDLGLVVAVDLDGHEVGDAGVAHAADAGLDLGRGADDAHVGGAVDALTVEHRLVAREEAVH